MKKYLLLLLVVPIILVSGCVQQMIVGRGMDFSLKADQPSLFASQSTTLYVDVENNDDRPYWKVFVDVFDPGMFSTQRLSPESGIYGSVRVMPNRTCKSSAECYDEDYGGCGVCIDDQCIVSSRDAQAGDSCDKTCECTPNINLGCRAGVCASLASEGNCRGGTPRNKCSGFSSDGTQSYFCDEFGNAWSQCQGMDEIIGTEDNTRAGMDDCGCPEGRQCRGDGTCGSQAECFATIYNILPGQIKTLECKLTAPPADELPKPLLSNDVNVRIRFSSKLSAMQTIEMISEEEYKLREFSSSLVSKPRAYSYRDKNMELDVEFSKDLPIIVRQGEKVYMYLTVKDISDGWVYPLRPDDFFIIQDGQVVGECDNKDTPIVLQPDGKLFPRVTCELKLPKEVNYISNYVAIINIDYSYEYRKTISVGIVK